MLTVLCVCLALHGNTHMEEERFGSTKDWYRIHLGKMKGKGTFLCQLSLPHQFEGTMMSSSAPTITNTDQNPWG